MTFACIIPGRWIGPSRESLYALLTSIQLLKEAIRGPCSLALFRDRRLAALAVRSKLSCGMDF